MTRLLAADQLAAIATRVAGLDAHKYRAITEHVAEGGTCKDKNVVDPEAFFPGKGMSTRAAKAACADCPVAAECLIASLYHPERFGVLGGYSERERRTLYRKVKAYLKAKKAKTTDRAASAAAPVPAKAAA